jgi:hypothetical protein
LTRFEQKHWYSLVEFNFFWEAQNKMKLYETDDAANLTTQQNGLIITRALPIILDKLVDSFYINSHFVSKSCFKSLKTHAPTNC